MHPSFCQLGRDFLCSSCSTESMESSMYVDFDIVSAALGYSLWYFFACFCSTNWAWTGDEFTLKTTMSNLQTSGARSDRVLATKSCDNANLTVQYQYVDTSPRCHRLLQLVMVEITVARQRNPLVAWTLLNVLSFRDTPSNFPAASNTSLVFAISLFSLSTG